MKDLIPIYANPGEMVMSELQESDLMAVYYKVVEEEKLGHLAIYRLFKGEDLNG